MFDERLLSTHFFRRSPSWLFLSNRQAVSAFGGCLYVVRSIVIGHDGRDGRRVRRRESLLHLFAVRVLHVIVVHEDWASHAYGSIVIVHVNGQFTCKCAESGQRIVRSILFYEHRITAPEVGDALYRSIFCGLHMVIRCIITRNIGEV